MNVLSVKVDDDMYETIERARAELGMNKTEFMTLALTLFLGSYRHIQETIEDHLAECANSPSTGKQVCPRDSLGRGSHTPTHHKGGIL